MSASFILKKEPREKTLLKSRYFVMGGLIDMNVGVFWETSVGFFKSVVVQRFPKYSQIINSQIMLIRIWKVGRNSTVLKK